MRTLKLLAICVLALIISHPSLSSAAPDQYMGDASIYQGVAENLDRPNILFIIDNSQSTTKMVLDNVTYNPVTVYAAGVDDKGDACVDDTPGKECWLPYNIYKQDNQGDFATTVLENESDTLEALTCDPSNDNDNPDDDGADYVRIYLQQYGSYSGSGTEVFPTIDTDGSCSYALSTTSGEVYALGNYLNYLKGTAVTGGGDTGCVNVQEGSIVKAHEWKNDAWTPKKFSFFRATADHTSSNNKFDSPYFQEDSADFNKWEDLGGTEPPDWDGTSVWGPNELYTAYACNDAEEPPAETGERISQREVVFNTLADVTKYTASVVNFGAMVYGDNNSGAKLIYGLNDLAVGYDLETEGEFDVINPDCSIDGNSNYCQFLAALPGPPEEGTTDFDNCANYVGAQCVSSNTGRPQAESVFDTGYYFGAGAPGTEDYGVYDPVTMTDQLDPDDSPCGLNHIILITNGFSNGDGSPNLDIVGDADGDNYGGDVVYENNYGLGSHWLDDVTRYLKANHDITTHTVLAFQSYDDLVSNAAHDGGGQFHLANNEQELRRALMDIIASIINETSTSFVAPVVPASTTNRTISSNRVYLGLFKPQANGHWYGNVKKYGISDNLLTEAPETEGDLVGAPATYPDGSFDPDSVSYWSLQGSVIPSSWGDINPNSLDLNEIKGDGGEVDAGGIGGVLLKRVEALSADLKASNYSSTYKRDIFTFLPDGSGGWTKETVLGSNANLDPSMFGLPDDTMSWWALGHNSNLSSDWSESDDTVRYRNLLRYVNGFDSLRVEAGESVWDARNWIMGDVLHSRPVVFNYTQYGPEHENLCTAGADGKFNSSIIFVGANDGMMHAFRDCDGKELWGYIPDNVLDTLKYLPEVNHTNYVDSPPAILFYDKEGDGQVDVSEDLVVMVFGQRRGGGNATLADDIDPDNGIPNDNKSRGAYYALNITNPTSPSLMWKLDVDNFSELSEPWSLPVIKKIKAVGSSNIRYVAFVGSGYDTNEDLRYGDTQTFPDGTSDATVTSSTYRGGSVDGMDGSGSVLLATSPGSDPDGYRMRGKGVAAILVAQLVPVTDGNGEVTYISQTQEVNELIGTVIWSHNTETDYAFATDLRALDLNNNGGYIDRLYAGDLGGNLWRFDTQDRDPDNWTGEIIFSSNSTYDDANTGYINGTADSNAGRKIFYPPSVAKHAGNTWICFATGDREHPMNLAVQDRLYCLKDFDQTTDDKIDESKLVDVTENLLQSGTTAEVEALLGKLYSSPDSPVEVNGEEVGYYGWYIRLDGGDRVEGGDYGEKSLAEAVIFSNEVFFSTYQIKFGDASGCEGGNLGTSRLYRVDLETGEAVYNYDLTNDGSTPTNERAQGGEGEVLLRTDRVYELGEGIPSGIVQIVDSAGNVSLLISSSNKVEGIEGSNPTMTFPVYWIQW